MDMITSMNNPGLKKVVQLKNKSKIRKKEQTFIIEGTRMLMETPPEKIRKLYVSQSFEMVHKQMLPNGLQYEVVADKLFQTVADTKSPQGVLAVVEQLVFSLEDMLKNTYPHLILLDNIQDPGNLGTILRTGEGAGIDGIIMTRESADIYNPKVVRATMGSIYRVPFFYTNDMEGVVYELKERAICIYAAALEGSVCYDEPDYKKGTAFLIGNEGNGISNNLLKKSDQNIRVPMQGQVESLNAAIAASLLMYEAYRQRR